MYGILLDFEILVFSVRPIMHEQTPIMNNILIENLVLEFLLIIIKVCFMEVLLNSFEC